MSGLEGEFGKLSFEGEENRDGQRDEEDGDDRDVADEPGIALENFESV